jgi:hypothetical protein
MLSVQLEALAAVADATNNISTRINVQLHWYDIVLNCV